jgi:hypothetical protein
MFMLVSSQQRNALEFSSTTNLIKIWTEADVLDICCPSRQDMHYGP